MSIDLTILKAAPLLLVLAATPLSAQRLQYDAPTEPVRYQSLNPWLMYWVTSDGDTVGRSVTAFAVQRWEWSQNGNAFRVIIRDLALDTQRAVDVDTLDVDRTGRLTATSSNAGAPHARWDLLPYLPAGGTATVGATWTDSIGFGGANGPPRQRYEARRIHRIERVFDSAGVRLAEIASRGEVRYRDSHPVDSAAGATRWLDVRGPVTERALVRLDDGVLQSRHWEMDLRGIGGHPDVRKDSVPAGLRSSRTLRLLSPERYALLSRPFHGPDTTYTVLSQELLFLHVARATPDGVTSGVARADGWVGTTLSVFTVGTPRAHETIWSSHEDSVIRLDLAADGDSLRVSGSRTETHPIPAGAWAVADHAMSEHLVPALLMLQRTWTFQDFTVFRPFLNEWETGTVRVRELEDALLAEIVLADGASRSFVIFSEDGTLLYAEGGYDEPSFRVPRPGTVERARVDRILRRLHDESSKEDGG
jgi:hypothetical protein